ncbi:hypothetical protein KFK09_002703 [Dendrobium nobile]|uniref:Uncharacterized protein n=1 Tax=Dendrobium nobile TaxID=94219 RepID=A0A8T3C5N1_DENNO|nr:hypothetical protein KFK09_002703 [Dendrobium nobile]
MEFAGQAQGALSRDSLMVGLGSFFCCLRDLNGELFLWFLDNDEQDQILSILSMDGSCGNHGILPNSLHMLIAGAL